MFFSYEQILGGDVTIFDIDDQAKRLFEVTILKAINMSTVLSVQVTSITRIPKLDVNSNSSLVRSLLSTLELSATPTTPSTPTPATTSTSTTLTNYSIAVSCTVVSSARTFEISEVLNTTIRNLFTAVSVGTFTDILRAESARHEDLLIGVVVIGVPEIDLTTVVPATAVPTNQPTWMPTVIPTQSRQSVVPVLKITNLVSAPSNVTFRVMLSAVVEVIGQVSCLPMPATSSSTSALSDVGQVKYGAGVATEPFDSTSTSLSFSLLGLQPLSSYVLYCVATNSFGTSTALGTVQSTSVRFSTQCCISILFTNSPQSVLVDSSRYGSSLGSFIYEFSLGAAPPQQITVEPMLTDLEGNAVSSTELFVVSLSTLVFKNTSSQITGQFYLGGELQQVKSILVTLRVTGPSASMYFPPAALAVTVLSASSPQNAPSFVKAQLSDSGAMMMLVFNTATDLGGLNLTGAWKCSELFEFTRAESTSCQWINASAVQASSTWLVLGDPIRLLGGIVRARCLTSSTASASASSSCREDKTTAVTSWPLLAPLNPLVPIVILSVPGVVSVEDVLFIDASASQGHGGRKWMNVVWSVQEADENDDVAYNLLDYLTVSGDVTRRIKVPQHILSPGKITISLTLTNFVGLTGTAVKVISITADCYAPQVQITGLSSIVVRASDSVSLFGPGYLPSCAVNGTLRYTWRMNTAGRDWWQVTSLSSDPRKFVMPPYSLNMSTSYKIRVEAAAWFSGHVIATSTSIVSVFIASGDVISIIKGEERCILFLQCDMM